VKKINKTHKQKLFRWNSINLQNLIIIRCFLGEKDKQQSFSKADKKRNSIPMKHNLLGKVFVRLSEMDKTVHNYVMMSKKQIQVFKNC
jgi:hypothetical protein